MQPIRRFLSRMPPLAMDAALALATGLVAAFSDGLGADYRSHGAPVWDLALAAPLVLRRRAPAVGAAALGLICLTQWLAGPLANGDVSVLLMLYSLGVHESRRWLLAVAVAVAQLGVVLAVVRWGPSSGLWQTGIMLTGTVTASWALGLYVRTHRAYLDSMISRAESAERDRDTQAAMAVQAERGRMAREMHDIITHNLSVMITLNDAAAAVSHRAEARRANEQAADVGRRAMSEMQRLLAVLRADAPVDLAPQPGTAQLRDLVAMVAAAGLPVELKVTGQLDGLPATLELTLFRIVQESLTNVLKHATNVTQVTVDISNRAGRITVSIHNDGDPVVSADRASGHGLTGMRERLSLFNGHVQTAPAPDGGWQVTADLVNPDEPSRLAEPA